jgi:hypothetical protein
MRELTTGTQSRTPGELRKMVIRLRKKEMASRKMAELVGITESYASVI